MPWSSKFEDPLPGFRTLHDAANYIQKLPNAQQEMPPLLAAQGRGPLLHLAGATG